MSTEVEEYTSLGDQRLDVSLPAIGGKGVFTAELEAALRSGAVDLCVHSLKDLPTASPDGLMVAAVLPREDPQDVLVLPASGGTHTRGKALSVLDALGLLAEGAVVGTSSRRRAAMLRHWRRDIEVRDVRGNVGTRLKKLDDGSYSALVLAGAGLVRLGLVDRVNAWLPGDRWLPAPAQGIVAIQARSEDRAVLEALRRIHHAPTWEAATAERSLLRALDGGCSAPIGALCSPADDGVLTLTGSIMDVGGGPPIADVMRGRDASDLGVRLAARLRDLGGGALLARARAHEITPWSHP
jgi:hydroxymethylbilane synthase